MKNNYLAFIFYTFFFFEASAEDLSIQAKTRSDVTVGKLVWARLFWIADDQAEFPEVLQEVAALRNYLARNDVADDIAFRI